jgi:hypothetical protein
MRKVKVSARHQQILRKEMQTLSLQQTAMRGARKRSLPTVSNLTHNILAPRLMISRLPLRIYLSSAHTDITPWPLACCAHVLPAAVPQSRLAPHAALLLQFRHCPLFCQTL